MHREKPYIGGLELGEIQNLLFHRFKQPNLVSLVFGLARIPLWLTLRATLLRRLTELDFHGRIAKSFQEVGIGISVAGSGIVEVTVRAMLRRSASTRPMSGKMVGSAGQRDVGGRMTMKGLAFKVTWTMAFASDLVAVRARSDGNPQDAMLPLWSEWNEDSSCPTPYGILMMLILSQCRNQGCWIKNWAERYGFSCVI